MREVSLLLLGAALFPIFLYLSVKAGVFAFYQGRQCFKDMQKGKRDGDEQ